MKNSMLASARLSIRLLTRRQRIVYFSLVSGRAVLGIFDVAGIALIGLISAIAANGLDGGKAIVIFGLKLPTLTGQSLVLLVFIVLGIFVIKTLVALMLMRKTATFTAAVESEKAALIGRHLLSGDLDEVARFSKAEIQWAVMDSCRHAFTGMLNDIATLTTEGVLLVLITGMFIIVSPVSTAFVIVYFGAIVFAIQLLIERNLSRASTDATEGTIATTLTISDTLDAYREIAVLGKMESFLSKFRSERLRLARSYGTFAFLAGMPRYIVETALILGVVAFVAVQFASGQLSTGLLTVGVFLTGGVRIMASLLPMQGAVSGIKSHTGQAIMAQELLSEIREAPRNPETSQHEDSELPEEQTNAELPKAGGAAVQVRNASFTYPGAETASLIDISINVAPGETIALIGPSGAGKTTLVDLLLGLLSPDHGEVTVDGSNPTALRLAHPGVVSYVPQRPGLVSGSIAENVALGVPESEIDRISVRRALERAHLWDFVETLPEGVDTSIGKQADSLSGGQIQRLGLARALYVEPRIIVLDEATSALDAGVEALVSRTLEELGRDVTVIVIAHRLSTVQHSDCVYVLEGGKLIASGKFAELRKNVPMVAEYVELMSFEA
jgi:ABC-type multidrug transport system fused ATPase/permease subunit